MRLSQLFGRTLREVPAEAEMISHQLLLRAGFIRPLAAGIFSYLPLGLRTIHNIEDILRCEMDRIGGQEVRLPVVHPGDLWQRTGRWEDIDSELVRFSDRTGRDLVLAMTHEEVVADLLREEVRSYRDLPRVIYQIQTKFRDEPRSRGGLIRVREFTMKDAYSCHADFADLDGFYPRVYEAYQRVFSRCQLEVLAVEADSGMMGGVSSHEFMVLSERGEDALIRCPACGYSANKEAASFDRGQAGSGPLEEMKEIATPGCKTIAEVAEFLGVAPQQTLKAVFCGSDRTGQVVFVVIRGDLDVNMVKLCRVLGGEPLHPATADELDDAGIVPGYASPVGLSEVRVVADDSVTSGANFVAGANREGYHLTGVNYARDFTAPMLTDVAQAQQGHACVHCGAALQEQRGIEVGHLFKLGTRYSERLGASYLDSRGESRPVVMGSYGIGLGRLLATVVEQHHDANGIVWPVSLAPYAIHLLSVGASEVVVTRAEALYQDLLGRGYEVLYDDRSGSAGVKFNDADLIGLPIRLTVSQRTLAQDSVEWKRRCREERELVPLDALTARLDEVLAPDGGRT